MNIFYLDHDPKVCAEYHCDKHVIKMILEHVQILSTVYLKKLPETPLKSILYKPTHQNHPCTLWTAKSYGNYIWLIELTKHLNTEYKERYRKIDNHKSFNLIQYLSNIDKFLFEQDIFTVPFSCMKPEFIISSNPIENYRNYYIKDKQRFAKWKNKPVPDWFQIEAQ